MCIHVFSVFVCLPGNPALLAIYTLLHGLPAQRPLQALELFTGDSDVTKACDVWAFGVVMWEILSLGQRPFQAMSEQEVLTMLTAGKRSGGACI